MLITVNANVELVLIRDLLASNGIEYVEMNKTDSVYPWAFTGTDVYVSDTSLIDAKLLLIENQIG